MSNIIPMKFDEQQFPFTSDCWVDATKAAKHFERDVFDWLRLSSTREYAQELAEELGFGDFDRKTGISRFLVKTTRGRNGGTWIHPEMVIEFARWLSAKFARACDRHIKNLLLSQNVQFTDDQLVTLLTYREPTSWEKRFKDPFYQALSKMSGIPYFGHVGGCPAVFGQITAKWVYAVALPGCVYKEAKRAAKDTGDKIHQYLKAEALEEVQKQLSAVTNIANSSVDMKDFEARCMAAFPVKGQMKLLYAAA